jgi:hypothetical protein
MSYTFEQLFARMSELQQEMLSGEFDGEPWTQQRYEFKISTGPDGRTWVAECRDWSNVIETGGVEVGISADPRAAIQQALERMGLLPALVTQE